MRGRRPAHSTKLGEGLPDLVETGDRRSLELATRVTVRETFVYVSARSRPAHSRVYVGAVGDPRTAQQSQRPAHSRVYGSAFRDPRTAESFPDNHDAHVANIGAGWACYDQPIALAKKRVGVVGFKKWLEIQLLCDGSLMDGCVQNSTRRVGWAVFAIGASGQQRDALPLLVTQIGGQQMLVSRQDQLLISSAFAATIGRCQLNGWLAARDPASG